MASMSSSSLRPFFRPITTDLNDRGLTSRNFLVECLNEVEVKEPSISTMLLNFENKFDPYEAMSTPLYQTATFKQPSATENGPYDYTRSGNPTRDALESLLAKLDKADRAFCFTSGMAALAAVFSSCEEIVAGDDLYGGSDRLLSKVIPKKGVVVKRVNTTDWMRLWLPLDQAQSLCGWRVQPTLDCKYLILDDFLVMLPDKVAKILRDILLGGNNLWMESLIQNYCHLTSYDKTEDAWCIHLSWFVFSLGS
ncbi:hypothetical protein SLA2020_339070 [Shorea laevis]